MGKALILAALLLSGCTKTLPPPGDPRAVWCGQNKPRRDAANDTPRSVLDEINAHNRKGALWCRWKAKT